jgi:hypothetical protein
MPLYWTSNAEKTVNGHSGTIGTAYSREPGGRDPANQQGRCQDAGKERHASLGEGGGRKGVLVGNVVPDADPNGVHLLAEVEVYHELVEELRDCQASRERRREGRDVRKRVL